MQRVRWLFTAMLGMALSACVDAASGPALPNQSPSSRLLAYRDFHGGVASDLESYLSQHSGLGHTREQALEQLLARARVESQQTDLRHLSGTGPRLATNGQVDEAGIFDPTGTFEDIILIVSPSIWSFSKVTIPAVIGVEMAGTTTTRNQQYPIANTSYTAVPTWGYVVKVQLPEVNCSEAGATVTTATQHTAGWNVRGFGIVAASLRTTGEASCPDPQPCLTNGGTQVTDSPGGPNSESGGYDPYSPTESSCNGEGGEGSGTQYYPGDNTGGETVDFGTGMGNGGQSACGEAAVVEYVCLDIYDGEHWMGFACGYVTTC